MACDTYKKLAETLEGSAKLEALRKAEIHQARSNFLLTEMNRVFYEERDEEENKM